MPDKLHCCHRATRSHQLTDAAAANGSKLADVQGCHLYPLAPGRKSPAGLIPATGAALSKSCGSTRTGPELPSATKTLGLGSVQHLAPPVWAGKFRRPITRANKCMVRGQLTCGYEFGWIRIQDVIALCVQTRQMRWLVPERPFSDPDNCSSRPLMRPVRERSNRPVQRIQ